MRCMHIWCILNPLWAGRGVVVGKIEHKAKMEHKLSTARTIPARPVLQYCGRKKSAASLNSGIIFLFAGCAIINELNMVSKSMLYSIYWKPATTNADNDSIFNVACIYPKEYNATNRISLLFSPPALCNFFCSAILRQLINYQHPHAIFPSFGAGPVMACLHKCHTIYC